MDETDSMISFDENGVCDHCNDFYDNVLPYWNSLRKDESKLKKIVQKIKLEGKNNEFDSILGMSGGADSSYLLHLCVKELGLRPLVFHVDCGWNSDIATNNINVMIEKLDLDLYTEVINWKEIREFQLAYFKSGLSNIDVPQDHAFVATLYNFAQKHNIKYILNGGNISTECVRNPLEWLYYGTDMRQIRDILKRFSPKKLKSYPFSSVLRHKIYLRYFKKVEVVKPLNYMDYVKSDAMEFLKKEYGWMPYPQKHFESRFTRFYEGYWLPKRFGFDTRKVQLSSLILTNQITREDALRILEQPAMSTKDIENEFDFISRKLEISPEELNKYLSMPIKSYRDYKNSVHLFNVGAKAMKMLGMEASIKR